MAKYMFGLAVAMAVTTTQAAPPSFQNTSEPPGWTNVKGHAEGGPALQAKGGALLELQTTAPLALPVEATFRFRAAVGDGIAVKAIGEGKDAKPLLESQFTMGANNQASVTATSSGEPMATEAASSRGWYAPDKKGGRIAYQWRFPKVKNLWDDRDCAEIGSAYAA